MSEKQERGRHYRRGVVSPARGAAFEILRRVEEEDSYAAPLLAGAAETLRPGDRALCYELVLGTLRWQLWLDSLIEHYSGRRAEKLDAPVRRALRLGLYQLRRLTRVPASAAVNESVNLAYQARLRSAAPFINGVLRRATRELDYDPSEKVDNPIEKIAVRTSHPTWLIEKWVAMLGAEEAESLAAANNETPPLAFRVNNRVNELSALTEDVIEKLRQAGAEVEQSRVAPGGWRVRGAAGGTILRELVSEGLIYFQDEASQLVAHVLGARGGERILDACSAPGSKTTHLAALAGDRAMIVAGDVHHHRLRLVREAAERQSLTSVRPLALDAESSLPFADESFDRVLVDAPCTGTGTLRHNPEIRWRISNRDIKELAARQKKILGNAARALCRGGRLVYSTCSIEREENECVVEEFLIRNAQFRKISVSASPASLNVMEEAGGVRTWPHRDDVDGFFMAAFERAE
ncbi:MAG TPA: 16S rRNA (cytosine(967)-C(5))-methyltransferase RsmB [Pyrinomonadaceae bacterium]|nr:16S rRNA (cytosine(967)-C(5))-methyltransferase RsmB [Pyrinomonadaceae bacterium]